MPANDKLDKRLSGSNQDANFNRAQVRFSKKVKPKDIKKTVLRILAALNHDQWRLYLIVTCVFFSTLAGLLTPLYFGRGIDALSTGLFSNLTHICLVLGALYLINACLGWLANYLVAAISNHVARRLRDDLFEHMEKLPLAYFDLRSTGDLMSRYVSDLEAVTGVISQSTITLLSSFMTVMGATLFMLSLSPLLTIGVLISVPLIIGLSKLIANHTIDKYKGQQKAMGEINGLAEESVGGILAIKAMSLEETMVKRFNEASDRSYLYGKGAQIWSGLLMPLMNVINNLTFALIGLFGGYMALGGIITLGVVASFIGYSRQFVRPLNELAFIYNSLMAAIAGAERVFDVLDTESEVRCRSDLKPSLKGKIHFDRVSFSYVQGQEVLHDLSFHVKEGDQVAIVGPTGSGKTTIINLIANFYQVTGGKIMIDDLPLEALDYSTYIKQLGIVLQDSYLFGGSILENIRYGRPEARDEEVIRAAEKVGVHHMIMSLPKGYDTILNFGGTNISHGQRQLITIARALISQPRILILDEATSSVDLATEKQITLAMKELMVGKTSFVIAHRLSTIKEADQILVIKDGRLIECGDHEALLAHEGYYASMIGHI